MSDEVTDIATANRMIRSMEKTIEQLCEDRGATVQRWLAVYLCAMAFGAGYATHVWMDRNGYGECTFNDYCLKDRHE